MASLTSANIKIPMFCLFISTRHLHTAPSSASDTGQSQPKINDYKTITKAVDITQASLIKEHQ